MGVKADAWFLYAGDRRDPGPGTLVRERFELPDLGADEVLVAPIFGSWEGNMGHALVRNPVDVCVQRKEPRVVVGNAGVVRVVETGRNVTGVVAGDRAVLFGAYEIDEFGYMVKAFAYDAVGTMGILATRSIVKDWQLLPIPANSKHSLVQWAAFGIRYITAWSNWELAYGAFRLQLTESELPVLHVWGWGGGTTFAELDLAARLGHRAVMLSGSSDRLATIARTQITPLDRRPFGALAYDEQLARDPERRAAYERAEAAFLAEVRERTEGKGVHIFVDLIGEPVFRATLKALARQGVVTTAGWKHGMKLRFARAVECIERHQLLHTHYARRSQAIAAIEFAERTGWMPPVAGHTFSFDEIPLLAEQYLANKLEMFPVFAVNPE